MKKTIPKEALFVGRFQPFHKGHEKILAYLLRRYARITIAIGSAQEKRTEVNPFSAQERTAMIMRVVRSHVGWGKKIKFIFLADSHSNPAWVRAVSARFPPSRFAVASANPLVRKLLKNADYSLDPSPLFQRAEWEGKQIRNQIRKGGEVNLDKMIPPALSDWMRKKGKAIIFSTSRP